METSVSPAGLADPGLHPLHLLGALDDLTAADEPLLIRAGPQRNEMSYDRDIALLESGSFRPLQSVAFSAETPVYPVTFLRPGDARPFLTAFLRDDLQKATAYAFPGGDGHEA